MYVTVYERDAYDGDAALMLLESEPAENDYPALPVRAANVIVAVTRAPAAGNFLQQLILDPV